VVTVLDQWGSVLGVQVVGAVELGHDPEQAVGDLNHALLAALAGKCLCRMFEEPRR